MRIRQLLATTAVALSATVLAAGCSSNGAKPAGSMTLAKYDRLTNGMPVAEALAVTGSCDKIDDTSIAGVQTVTYTCNGADGKSSAVLVFQDGTLFSKTQVGLK